MNPFLVSKNQWHGFRGLHQERHGTVFILRAGAHFSQDILNCRQYIHWLHHQFHPAGFHPGEIQQVIDQDRQPFGRTFNHFQEMLLLGSQLTGSSHQHDIHIALDGCHGRA